MFRAFNPKVFRLGYVALETADIGKARAHYADLIGMTETGRGDDGEIYLSVGFDHHEIVLRKAEQKSLIHVGYQLNPGTDLKEFAVSASGYGLKAEIKSDAQPGVAQLVEVEAPGKSILQFYTDIEAPAPGFVSKGCSPLRLGHFAVVTDEADKMRQFYEEFLGFRKTDDLGGFAHFYTCNREHHTINIVDRPESWLHHIAFELRDNGYHAVACDALRAGGVPMKWGPARHGPGHNYAGYHTDPDNNIIETFTEIDIYVPELNMCEARPWHEYYPMRPKSWAPEDGLCAWGTEYNYDFGLVPLE
jgi:catechol-2,3-dioxygenase